MSKPVSPYESNPPTAKRLLISVLVALASAAAVLLIIILPAEYNIDPTRIGAALGLTALHAPTRTVQIVDVVGGNEKYREAAIPDPGEPMPLPNPAVFQQQAAPARTETLTITLQPEQETEIKTVLKTAQVVLFSWQAEGGEVYVDFHGHEPGAGDDAWVRYEEQQSGTKGSGSLVAPFAGEHGWYWVNISANPVTIKLSVSGYYDKIVNYGLLNDMGAQAK